MTRESYSRPNNLVRADYTKIDPLLISLLELCTPHGDENHIVSIIRKQSYIEKITVDKVKGNIIIEVGERETNKNMFSCHMDIVGQNSKDAKENKLVDRIHLLTVDTNIPHDVSKVGLLYGAKRFIKENGESIYIPSTLGADDKVGVYICLKMIKAKIPGMYVFHTGEECGAVGSSHLVKHHKDLFTNIKKAIAFDRAGYGDVIAFQRGRRSTSKEFSEALRDQLNKYMPPKQQFEAEVTGSFTDTASYMDIIPECANMSVGYFNQHGPNECLDYIWLKHMLLPAILKVDWNALPAKRDPSKTEYKSYAGGNYSYSYDYSHYDKNRISWDLATTATPFHKFPLWEPKMGHFPEAKEELVKLAIANYIQSCYGEKKKELINNIYWNYEYIDILEDEIDALREQLKGKNKQSKKKDPNIVQKKLFLQKLIEIGKVTKLFEEVQDKWLQGYLIGAKSWLDKNHGRNHTKQFTKKELIKLNRLIYSIACLVDMVDHHDEHMKVLDDLQTYITNHPEEEGFVLPQQQIEIQNRSAMGFSTTNKGKQLQLEYQPEKETVH